MSTSTLQHDRYTCEAGLDCPICWPGGRYNSKRLPRKNPVYVTSYCNKPHRLSDGKPVKHECRIIPPRALEKERAGDIQGAIADMQLDPRRIHRGTRS